MSTYHYLFTDDEDRPLARVRYHFTPLSRATHLDPADGGELVVDEIIPESFEIGRAEELELKLNAAHLDRDEAEAQDQDHAKDHPMPHTHSIRWGIRG